MTEGLTGKARLSRVQPRWGLAADIVVLAYAIGFYLVTAADNIESWPANRVLLGETGANLLLFGIWLLYVWSIASNALLYGWPEPCGPGEFLRAMFWASRRRPAWANLPPSMRGPAAWMWLALVLCAAGAVLVVLGSAAAGISKGELRVLPGPRYEVSVAGLHDAAWTRVSAAGYQAYRARFIRESSISTFFAVVLIANSGYALFLRRELLRTIAD